MCVSQDLQSESVIIEINCNFLLCLLSEILFYAMKLRGLISFSARDIKEVLNVKKPLNFVELLIKIN